MLRIRELRIEKGLTQKELAEKINSTSKSIWAYENNIAVPPLDVLSKLSDVFECSIDYLVARSDDFGNVSVYQTDNSSAISTSEQKILDTLRERTPYNPVEWMSLYAELPSYMQESIFAELKGMHLGYKAASKKKGNMNEKLI